MSALPADCPTLLQWVKAGVAQTTHDDFHRADLSLAGAGVSRRALRVGVQVRHEAGDTNDTVGLSTDEEHAVRVAGAGAFVRVFLGIG